MSFEIGIITAADSAYPSLLKEIHKPPQQLYYRGDISLVNHPHMLAVIGSRKATSYGEQATERLLPECIRSGITIVSGLAYGIDSVVHQMCVAMNAPTIAVLGSGIDDASIYPKSNLTLAHNILSHGGLLLSEYPPGTGPAAAHFPARNRIIAGITTATLVIQAAIRSGSLITARLAMESNRDVLAVPGPITDAGSEGTNILIRDGATPALEASDILSVLEALGSLAERKMGVGVGK